jgi:hypothetical protein
MKNLLLSAVTACLVAGCASTVPFTIQSAPAGATKEQVQLDNLTCSNMSRTNGPWMYGIGTAIIKAEAAKRYQKCMSDKGYAVARGSGGPPPDFMQGVKIDDASDQPTVTDNSSQNAHPAITQPPAQQPAAADADVAQTLQPASIQTPAATRPSDSAPPATNSAAPGSPAGRLEELDKLYKSGLITKKEYEQKRQEILATL